MSALSEKNNNIIEFKSITVYTAALLQEAGLEAAKKLNIKNGFLAVIDSRGAILSARAIGQPLSLNVDVAIAKGKTVNAIHRSTSVQRERMAQANSTTNDYSGTLGSLFPGGVAIFLDENHSDYVGAIVFGGGTGEEDEIICLAPVLKAGFFTDVVPTEQQKIKLASL